jgi:hypothetical protein
MNNAIGSACVFSAQIVGHRTLHGGAVPVLAVDSGRAGVETLLDGKARKYAHD